MIRLIKILIIIFILTRTLQQLQFGQTETDASSTVGLEKWSKLVSFKQEEKSVSDNYMNGFTRYGTTQSPALPGSDPQCIGNQANHSDKRLFKLKRLIQTSKVILSSLGCSFHVWNVFFKAFFESLRINANSRIFSLLGVATSNLVTELSVGNSVYQVSRLKSKIKVTGTQHLLAVSGMHLSIFLRLVAGPVKRHVSKRWFGIGSFWLVLGYLSLVEPSYSLVRAGLMACFSIYSSLVTSRQYNPLFSIFTCFIFLIIIDVSVLSSLSFQMSFVATTAIVISSKYGFTRGILSDLHLQNTSSSIPLASSSNKYLSGIRSYVIDSIKIGVTVQMLLLPLVMYHFGSFSVISIFATILVSWLLPILIPLSLFSVFSSSIFPNSSFVLQLLLLPTRFFAYIFLNLLEFFNSEIFLVEIVWFGIWHLLSWWFVVIAIFVLSSKINKKAWMINSL